MCGVMLVLWKHRIPHALPFVVVHAGYFDIMLYVMYCLFFNQMSMSCSTVVFFTYETMI